MTLALARPQFSSFAHLFGGVREDVARARWEAMAYVLDSFILEAFGEGHARNSGDDGPENEAELGPHRLQWKEAITTKFKRAADSAEGTES